jgi:membrane protein YdbS with pleckstrin-like domain
VLDGAASRHPFASGDGVHVTDDSKPCPVCGETIKAAASKCRFCGTDLVALEQAREAEVEKELFSGHPLTIISVGQWALVAVTLGIAYLVYWLRSRSTNYTFTTQRVRVERGLLSTVKDSVELFRLDHFDIHKPIGMRLLGHCALHLRSSDEHVPSIVIAGVPNLEQLADQLRECSLRERTRRRITTLVQA